MPRVTAVGFGAPQRSGRSARIELAVRLALKKALDAGETRPAVLRAIIREAHDRAKEKLGQT